MDEDVGFFGDTTIERLGGTQREFATIGAGMSLINTGDFYGQGHNESIVARAIKHRRKQAFLSVKFGILRSPPIIFLVSMLGRTPQELRRVFFTATEESPPTGVDDKV